MAVVPKRAAQNDDSTATQYNGTTTITPATTRLDAKYATERIPITSNASISSLIRIAPNWAVAPAPIVAANPIAAITGASSRTLKYAEANPVSASTPTLANSL